MSFTQNSDGKYDATCTVVLSNHRYEKGDYNFHTYITCGNGAYTFLCAYGKQIDYQLDDINVSLSSDQMQISVMASVAFVGSATRVRYAVWTEAGGQDDLI